MSDKISSIENSLIELNRMFEVSAIASNAISIEDLVSKLSDFLSDYLNSNEIYFFALEKKIFKKIVRTPPTKGPLPGHPDKRDFSLNPGGGRTGDKLPAAHIFRR